MHIDEIPGQASVSVRVTVDGRELELLTNVTEALPARKPGKHSLTVQDFLHDVQERSAIGFGDVYFYSERERSCIVWKGAVIEGTGETLLLTEKGEGEHTDRRGAYRIPLHYPCTADIRNAGGPCEADVCDISISGIAFDVSSDRVGYTEVFNKALSISFTDTDSGTEFELDCICKNVRGMGKGTIRCGCSILKSNVNLTRYIQKKQVELHLNEA